MAEQLSYTVEMMDVRKKFGDKEVLKGVNFALKKGEIFGLLGPSGAGKTTIIKILTGQLAPLSGKGRILGCDTQSLNASIYQKIGVMLDNFGLYERLSCSDNLTLFAKIYQIPAERAKWALAQVGLEEAAKTQVSKLSKGMRSRLSLARAVMSGPDILFLDEPTSGLDPATANWIHQLIREEQKRGATIFLTTHNMEEADKLCDHVALLNEGKIVEYGEPEAVRRKYDHQNKLKIKLKDGNVVELANGSAAADEVMKYLKKEMIMTIHSMEPGLETVFMELTGRRFE